MKLYEISNEYQKIIDLIQECGEITPELMEQLDNINMSAEEKIRNTAAMVKNLELELEAVEKYIHDMEKRKKRIQGQIEWNESYLQVHMDKMQLKKMEYPEFDVCMRTNQYKLDLFDQSLVPQEYVRVKETVSISREDIKKDLKLGLDVPGARFITTKSVQIR